MSHAAGHGFVTTSLELVHDWTYSQLVRRTVLSPDGESFDRTYVDSPGAVAVVAVTGDDEIVLVSQYRATVDGHVVEIPAGMKDVDGEPGLETARRELVEEVGFEASSWVSLGSILSTPGVSNSVVELYLATGLTAVPVEPHGPEERVMKVMHVPFAEAVHMCMDDSIIDSKSVTGILRAARLLGR